MATSWIRWASKVLGTFHGDRLDFFRVRVLFGLAGGDMAHVGIVLVLSSAGLPDDDDELERRTKIDIAPPWERRERERDRDS
jgi:hypothetical protein